MNNIWTKKKKIKTLCIHTICVLSMINRKKRQYPNNLFTDTRTLSIFYEAKIPLDMMCFCVKKKYRQLFMHIG